MGILDEKTEQNLRWQHSPLVARMHDVARASGEHWAMGARVGNNKATLRIVGAAEELRLLLGEIAVGTRDGLGYKSKASS
jgi:hypothetical protein